MDAPRPLDHCDRIGIASELIVPRLWRVVTGVDAICFIPIDHEFFRIFPPLQESFSLIVS